MTEIKITSPHSPAIEDLENNNNTNYETSSQLPILTNNNDYSSDEYETADSDGPETDDSSELKKRNDKPSEVNPSVVNQPTITKSSASEQTTRSGRIIRPPQRYGW